MASLVLTAAPQMEDRDQRPLHDGLGSAVLVHNVRWFIRVRWVVVAVFVLAGAIAAVMPGLVTMLGLVPPYDWTWQLAGVLAAANVCFGLLARHLTTASSNRLVAGNIWLQIVTDLIVVTFLVHCAGSTSTFIAFTYLFHIVLACIFFAPAQSLLVTLVAANLYLLCVCLEVLGLWPPAGMEPLYARQILSRNLALVFAASAVFVWLVVWYLVSTLSQIVKERDRLLESANQRLRVADEEKNRLMLCTAHDLKAPFSGIESNIQMLKSLHWDQLPPPARELVSRIERRGQTLSTRISDMLLLGELRTQTTPATEPERVDLAQLLQEVREELDAQAQSRHVRLQLQAVPLVTRGLARHYFILFSNVIANAIAYSQEGGTVEVTIWRNEQEVWIATRDNGIGIPEKVLPHIFDEYFRSAEAAQWNPGSTGLGLAIAKEIVQKEDLKIVVTSVPGQETIFRVALPVGRCEFSKEHMPWPKAGSGTVK